MRLYRRIGLVVLAFGLAAFASNGPSPAPTESTHDPGNDDLRAFEEAFVNADVNDPEFVALP